MTGGWGSEPAPPRVEDRIAIEPDGTVIAKSGKVEYGQGIRTAFAKIVAEELAVPLGRIRVELGETDRVPWDWGTAGSRSVASDGQTLRAAAAFARAELIARAGAHLGLRADTLRALDGAIIAPDGSSVSFSELVAGRPITGVIPPDMTGGAAAPPETSAPFRVEGRDIVTGRARFVADVRLPGMLRGYVAAPPAHGARLQGVSEAEARAVPGVVAIVRDGDFAGAVAEHDEQALAAVRALNPVWVLPAPPDAAAVDLVLRRDPGFETPPADPAVREHRASYHTPHISHAPIGPSAAVADVRGDGADLYVGTQRPFGVRDDAARLLGLPVESVRVHPMHTAGTYGRNNSGDAVLDAVRLSRAVGRPVLVQWTRADEFVRSPHRPTSDAELSAALDGSGRIVRWRSDLRTNPHTGALDAPARVIEMTSGRNSHPPYELGLAEILLHVVPTSVRTGSFRSLAAAANVFAIESFIDELAHAASADPFDFRLRHVHDPRLARVLGAARNQSRWDDRPRDLGVGFGVACAIYHGTYVAEVARVSVDGTGKVRLERVWCAADPGRLVHPDGAKNQLEGGIQQSASWTLLESLPLDGACVAATSFDDYPIATFHDAPASIDVVFAAEQSAPSTGLGEPGAVPVAAAIANAVFAATGARVRTLPLTPNRVKTAMLV